MKIEVAEDEEPWDIIDDDIDEDILKEIDDSVNPDYLTEESTDSQEK